MGLVSTVGDWFLDIKNDTWIWITRLNHQEWFVLLGIVAVLGFLCMRGFGSNGRA